MPLVGFEPITPVFKLFITAHLKARYRDDNKPAACRAMLQDFLREVGASGWYVWQHCFEHIK
jgi:hypothetical protein